MKRSLTIAVLASSMCLNVLAAQGEEESWFRSGEWQVSPFATYVDKSGDKWGLGASGTYFLTKNLGLGASTYWTDFGGTFIDNLAGEAYFRVPILQSISPYAVGSVGYQFDSEEWFETIGAGVDLRATDHFGVFSDIQYRFANDTKDGIFIRLGVRIAL